MTLSRNDVRFTGHVNLAPVIGSVADKRCIRDVFEQLTPQLLYHAAGLKHVPFGEMNPFAVAQNNISGTSVVANFARLCDQIQAVAT